MRSLKFFIPVTGLLAVTGYYAGGAAWLTYVFKPLTTILILLLGALLAPANPRYKRAVVTGLLFSLGGDVFLMLPGDYFLPGLVCFLIAHISYLLAFTSDCRFGAHPLPFLLLGVVACGVLAFLWPALPAAMRVPVVVYVALLTSMAAQANARRQVLSTRSAAFAAAGGVLFVISDAALAINRFGHPFALASAVVLSTYYAAQYLIARSIRL